MGYLEDQVERYKKRIRRIDEQPSDVMLKSNRIFYELLLEQHENLLNTTQAGMPYAFAVDIVPYRLIQGMGILPFSTEMAGDYLPRKQVSKYFERIRATGFPEDACDRIQLSAAFIMAVEEGELPKPNCVIGTSADCDGLYTSMVWAGQRFKVPTVIIDCPLVDTPYEDRWEALKYVEEQLWNMIKFLEKEVPGAKYDAEKHMEYQLLYAQNMFWQRRFKDLTRNKPCPVGGRDVLRMPPLDVVKNPKVIEYYKVSVSEIEERLKQGKPALKKEYGRVAFLTSAPFYMDGFKCLEEKGIAMPVYEEGAGFMDYPTIDDEKTWGRKLTLMECEAAWCISPQWHGVAERRWKVLRDRCEELDIDGLVHFEIPGCQTCNGCAKIIADLAEKEKGIASLEIQGWCQDEAKFDLNEYVSKMEEFADTIISRKAAAMKQ